MNVTLREITADNWGTAIRLKVRTDQNHFVASNVYSLAQSKFEPFWQTKGIYAEETMVGFCMYGLDEEEGEWSGYWICRLMVDQTQQGHGYGRAGMEAVLREVRESGYQGPVYISFEPNNTVAEELYQSLGFADTGKMTDDQTEKISVLHMK